VSVSLHNTKKHKKGENLMNTNKSKRFVNVLAGAISAAGILGGGALGLAAGANASTASPAQVQQEHAAGVQAPATLHPPAQRKGTPARPVAHKPSPTIPGQQPVRERPR
jgi:hypothetical protein